MKDSLYSAVPALAMFGPLFIVVSIPGLSFWQRALAIAGAFAVGLAVLAVFIRQKSIESRIDTFEEEDPEASRSIAGRRSGPTRL